ncbi:MAG: hypothetical protein ABI263_06735 [Gelidibacter sp.]
MSKIDLIARTLVTLVSFGFFIAGVFDVLDYFIVKLFLFGGFSAIVIYMCITLYKNETHRKA